MTRETSEYAGGELDLFREAVRWKRHFGARIAPWLRGDVLEVGAGIGGTTRLLCRPPARSWSCLEPDPALAERLRAALGSERLEPRPEVLVGELRDVPAGRSFDAILYIDVLEHISDDRGELDRAASRLRPGGRLVVLAPAHAWLFTAFDRAVGHHRRYTARTLRAAGPAGCALEWSGYLDAAGLLASLGNRLFLRRSLPTRRQIAFWDSILVPVSRLLDPLLAHRVGKSVLAVWTRPPEADSGASGAGGPSRDS